MDDDDDKAQRIEMLFGHLSGPASPGAVWSVMRDGREIASGASGMADIAHGVPLDRSSVIRIGSQTKQFTVLLALLLEAEGKLSMADPVHRHAPWLPPFPAPVTLQHLATNTSGLRDFLEIMTLGGVPLAGPATRTRQREMIARHRDVNFAAGRQMIYCNTGFWLLSEIIEQVSGRSFNELLESRITGPLGMSDTRLLARDSAILPRLAAHHAHGPDGAWETARWGWDIGGEGGMASTLDDMRLWQANLANPDASDAAMLARMATPLTYTNATTGLYAMGLSSTSYRGQHHVGHGGSVAGGRSESMWFPDAGLGIVILANLDAIAPHSLALRIADIVLGDRLAPFADGDTSALAGLYRQERRGEIFAVQAGADGALTLVTGAGPVRLNAVSPGVFAPERVTMDMTLAPSEGGLDVVWCGETRRYVRLGAAPAAPPDISGRYLDSGTGLAARVSADEHGGELVLASEFGVHRIRLAWLDRDLLSATPADARPGAGWIGSVRLSGRDLVLTTDRTKHLTLRRA